MNSNEVSILVSSILGGLSLIFGLLSLWFAYAFSSRRYKNRYLKEFIRFAKSEINNRPNYSIENFCKDNGNLHFAKESKTDNSYVMPQISISENLLSLSNLKLKLKIKFIFDKDYFIKWEKTEIVPLRKLDNGILLGPKKSEDFIWPFSKIDPLDNSLITKQAFNLTRSLVLEKRKAIKISKRMSNKR